MKAITYQKYGQPEQVLSLGEVEKPSPKPNEVLLKVKATAVNDYDWSLVTGKPFLYRLMFGIQSPKHRTPSMEVAGVIEQIGSGVEGFEVGDAVVGDTSDHGFGTFAEYMCIDAKALIRKPADLSFETAVAIPHAATLAWQALHDIAGLKQGQKVLINGGGGGVGTLGLQMAKLLQCEVTGVDSQAKLPMMTNLGFDHVIDYRSVDFTTTGKQYDVVLLDCKSNRSPFAYLRALTPEGIYVTIGGNISALLKIVFWGSILSAFTSKKLKLLGLKTNKDLSYLVDLVAKGKLHCQIDGPYALAETPRLIQYFGEGKHSGKIVVRV